MSTDFHRSRSLTPFSLRWNPMRLVRGVRRHLRLRRTDLSVADRFVIFVGNPRSGTTLVRSLLNAHASVIISNEVDVLRYVARGDSWNSVLGRILDNERQFAAEPVWNGYHYEVPHAAPGLNHCPIRVIGDKKACISHKHIEQDPALLERLQSWSPLPVQFLHCVRHPFDVITTKTRKNGHALTENIDRYFRAERTAELVHQKVGEQASLRIHQEDLILSPTSTLERMLSFLGLDSDDHYVRACRAVIYESPHKSRHGIDWPKAAVLEVERRAKRMAHLQRYLTDNRLPFHDRADATICATDRAAA